MSSEPHVDRSCRSSRGDRCMRSMSRLFVRQMRDQLLVPTFNRKRSPHTRSKPCTRPIWPSAASCTTVATNNLPQGNAANDIPAAARTEP